MEKIPVEVCVGTSCHLMGSNLILEFLETLSDNIKDKIEIKYQNCMNACDKGPRVRVGDIVLSQATPEMVEDEIKKRLVE
ncbi:MAG: NAD(P)H-dependent oxidoreductase subunit E [Halothermotrichaceae bacterium]